MAGQAMAGSFFSADLPNSVLLMITHLVCVLVPKLNSGRLLYTVVVMQNNNLRGHLIPIFLGWHPPVKTMLYTASSPNSKSWIEPWLAARTQSFRTGFCLAGLSAAVHFDLN